MSARILAAPAALWRSPVARVVAVLTLVPLVLSFLPGWPASGYGPWIFLLLPAWLWLRRPAQRRRLGWYALGIGLQVLAYPDPDLGFLGWILLWPYLRARELPDGAPWWRAAFLYGFYRAGVGFAWLANVHFTAWITVTVLSGLAFATVFELGVRKLAFLPWALRVATAWVAFEGLHAWLFNGFPWLFLAHTQYRHPALLQAADLCGAFGISFLMAFVQAAALRVLRERRLTRESLAAVLLLAAALAYGLVRPAPEGPPGPGVLLVQTSVPHSVKEELLGSEPGWREMWRSHVRQTEEALRLHPDAALVVWPETMMPFPYVQSRPGPFLRATQMLAEAWRRPVVYGANVYPDAGDLERGFNAAVLCDAEGRPLDVYRKQRLVPMGEEFVARWFLPDRWCTPMFRWLSENAGLPRSCDLEAGKGFVTLDAGRGLRCAVLICFEGLYPDLARGAVATGDPDFLLLLVNNGWFGHSFEQRQFVAACVFRAIETRTPVLVCANTGITCAVAADGTIVGEVDRVMEPGALYVHVPPRGPAPPWPAGRPWLLPLLLGLAAGVFGLLGRRSGSPSAAPPVKSRSS